MPKTWIYYIGKTTDAASIQSQLTAAEKVGKLKGGYLIYFWPQNNSDCHVGIYAGKDAGCGSNHEALDGTAADLPEAGEERSVLEAGLWQMVLL